MWNFYFAKINTREKRTYNQRKCNYKYNNLNFIRYANSFECILHSRYYPSLGSRSTDEDEWSTHRRMYRIRTLPSLP